MQRLGKKFYDLILSVPVNYKIAGIMLLSVLILGLSLNYWVTSGLADWLSYLLTDTRVQAAMTAGRRSVTLVTFLAAAMSILLATLLTHVLTQPLHELRTMALKVADGDLDARAPVYSKDEIGDVATAINTMTDHLVQAQTDLIRSNRRLTAINRVIQAADREQEIHDVLYVILSTVLDVLNLEMGWVYLRDPEHDLYHLASWCNVPPELGVHLLHPPERALCRCQQMLLDGGLVPADIKFCECGRIGAYFPATRRASHITLPIVASDQRMGVVNLLCSHDRTLSGDDMDLLSAISTQISEVVSNAWLRIKLTEKEQARQYLLESLVDAQEEERGRLARELHDGAGQMLTSLLVRLKVLENQADSPDLKQEIASSLDMVSKTIEQVRNLSYHLRPAALEEFGLAVVLRTLVAETLEESGVTTRCRVDLGDLVLPHGVEVTLYRIAQEALTNVFRHAKAQNVMVDLVKKNGGVTLQIQDDGCGFHPRPLPERKGKRHMGLISMTERAEMVNGSLRVESTPGQGTTIHIYIPIQESAIA
ncbi:MAG: HAMP domain-containing protein [Caldilineaceae bacterium]|nr:HAMP domain-containing protein [Caldilineaceae bacterium]MBP8110003.1 HAMP domain-containing protein [Caldilineaceae bacterium]MBP8125162.1 HAMP domain-containing protein [Caldilineaceae bacterium]MBP9074678.1 HAMP domain-containing protein [Caldilineaceae bacterium]